MVILSAGESLALTGGRTRSTTPVTAWSVGVTWTGTDDLLVGVKVT